MTRDVENTNQRLNLLRGFLRDKKSHCLAKLFPFFFFFCSGLVCRSLDPSVPVFFFHLWSLSAFWSHGCWPTMLFCSMVSLSAVRLYSYQSNIMANVWTTWGWGMCEYVIQYCRVPKNGLPKNGQAGISPKNKNDPGWKNELRTVHHTQRAFAVKTTSSAALLGLRTPPLRRFETFQPHSMPSMRRHIPFARYKLTYVPRRLIVK